jgi:hypothetical protein
MAGEEAQIGQWAMTAFKIAAETIRRGHRLAKRRRAHFAELELTGRWHLHFKQEADFKAQLKAAEESVDTWARIEVEAGD